MDLGSGFHVALQVPECSPCHLGVLSRSFFSKLAWQHHPKTSKGGQASKSREP